MNLRSNAGMDLYCFENANSLDLTYGKCVIKHCELKLCLVLGRLNLFLNYINMPKSGSAARPCGCFVFILLGDTQQKSRNQMNKWMKWFSNQRCKRFYLRLNVNPVSFCVILIMLCKRLGNFEFTTKLRSLKMRLTAYWCTNGFTPIKYNSTQNYIHSHICVHLWIHRFTKKTFAGPCFEQFHESWWINHGSCNCANATFLFNDPKY